MNALPSNLTIPLVNFFRESSSILSLRDARIVPKNGLSDPIQTVLKAMVKDVFDFAVEISSKPNEEPRRTLDRVLTVFKLFRDSLVLSNLVAIGTESFDPLPHYTHWIDQDRGLPRYDLTKNEEAEFIKFWNEFIDVPQIFPVYRFHLADYRAYSSDRFVDYVESLEYLLVPDSGEGEIGYKFRSRGTLIFGQGKTAQEREHIYDELRDTYALRSAIVHGDRAREEDLRKGATWEDKLRPTRCYDREAIKFFFRHGCLDNSDRRKRLLEKLLIFDSKIESIDMC